MRQTDLVWTLLSDSTATEEVITTLESSPHSAISWHTHSPTTICLITVDTPVTQMLAHTQPTTAMICLFTVDSQVAQMLAYTQPWTVSSLTILQSLRSPALLGGGGNSDHVQSSLVTMVMMFGVSAVDCHVIIFTVPSGAVTWLRSQLLVTMVMMFGVSAVDCHVIIFTVPSGAVTWLRSQLLVTMVMMFGVSAVDCHVIIFTVPSGAVTWLRSQLLVTMVMMFGVSAVDCHVIIFTVPSGAVTWLRSQLLVAMVTMSSIPGPGCHSHGRRQEKQQQIRSCYFCQQCYCPRA